MLLFAGSAVAIALVAAAVIVLPHPRELRETAMCLAWIGVAWPRFRMYAIIT